MTKLPVPPQIDPASIPSLGWGIVGTRFAAYFTNALQQHTPHRVRAVTGRDYHRTAAFADDYSIPKAYQAVTGILDDPTVDVVYIATPPGSHADIALQAIAAGKHVLIEKPFAASAAEARVIVDAARAAGVFVMEAMWTRYLPQSTLLRQLLAEGVLGDVHSVTASFGFAVPFDRSGRMWDPAQGGGALLDAGVYPISFASSILGTPIRVQASGITTPDRIDLRSSAILTSATGADATVATSMISRLPNRAAVIGSEARLEFEPSFFTPTTLVLTGPGDDVETWTDTTFTEGYEALSHQTLALATYLGEGRTESPVHPLDEVISVLATIDEIRSQLTVTTR